MHIPGNSRSTAGTPATGQREQLPEQVRDKRQSQKKHWDFALSKLRVVEPRDQDRMCALILAALYPAHGGQGATISKLRKLLPSDLRGENARHWELLDKVASDREGYSLCRVTVHKDYPPTDHIVMATPHETLQLERTKKNFYSSTAASVPRQFSTGVDYKTLSWEDAVKKGDQAFLKKLGEAGARLEADLKLGGEPMLQVACAHGLPLTAALAIEAGCNVNEPDSCDILPIMHAIAANNPAIIDLLLEKGARTRNTDPQSVDGDALLTASQSPEPGMFETILKAGGPLTDDAYTLRLGAFLVKESKLQHFDTLLKHVPQANKEGLLDTVLASPWEPAQRPFLDLALAHHPDLNKHNGPLTLLHKAVLDQQPVLLEALLERHAETSRDATAGVDINRQKSGDDMTAMHLAIFNKFAQARDKLILVDGLDLNIRDGQQNTPLSAAIKRDQPEFALKIMDYGRNPAIAGNKLPANLDITNQFGLTPLMFSLSKGYADVALRLITLGCNLDIHLGADGPVLHQVIGAPPGAVHPDILSALLAPGRHIDLDARDGEGRTALHLATQMGNLAQMTMLLQRGANPNLASNPGDRGQVNTPLHLAVKQINVPLVLELLRHQANPAMEMVPGQNALQIAQNYLYQLQGKPGMENHIHALETAIIPALAAAMPAPAMHQPAHPAPPTNGMAPWVQGPTQQGQPSGFAVR